MPQEEIILKKKVPRRIGCMEGDDEERRRWVNGRGVRGEFRENEKKKLNRVKKPE